MPDTADLSGGVA